MKVLAIVQPGGLVAKELRGQLEGRPHLWRELRLLTTAEEEVGTLSDVAGGAAIVQRLSAETLEGVDLAFLFGGEAESRRALAELPPGARAVVFAPDHAASGPPRVAGVNLPDTLDEPVVRSPHPGAVLLALLLHPLRPLGLARAEATLLQPVSVFPAESLDQLFEQARGLLTFSKVPESVHWQRQLAFNLQSAEETGIRVREDLAAVLGGGPAVTATVVQAGVFHGFGASVHLAFSPDPGQDAIRDALESAPRVRWADDQEGLGPVDVAGGDEVLLGALRADGEPAGSYWAWAVMDNLTRGGASNALAIAEALLG